MKLLFLNENFSLGGIQRVTKSIGEALSSENEVFFYSMFKNENFYDIETNFVDGQHFIFKYKLLRKIYKSRKLFEQLRYKGQYTTYAYNKPSINKLVGFCVENEIDIIILSGPLLTSFVPYVKKLIPNIKIISWQHNNFDVYKDNYAKYFLNSYFQGLKQSDRVICLSKTDLSNYGKFNINTRLIYNPLSMEISDKISNLNSKYISVTGRLDVNHKGIDLLVKLVSLLPKDWKVVYAGDGSYSEKSKINDLVKEYKVENKIIFKGALTNDLLVDHYLKSSIYLMTSRWEGMPLVLAEAMNYGLPIISFDNSGSREVLQDGDYGVLVQQENIIEMLEKLIELINDTALREYFQKKSLERVKDFHLNQIIPKWNEMLMELNNE